MSQALLQRNGVEQVDTAENGLQAVLAALSDLQKYDVLFMDNFMPVMVTTQRNYFSQLRGRECYCVVMSCHFIYSIFLVSLGTSVIVLR